MSEDPAAWAARKVREGAKQDPTPDRQRHTPFSDIIRDLQDRVAALEVWHQSGITPQENDQMNRLESTEWKELCYVDLKTGQVYSRKERQALRDIIALVDANQSCVWEETLDEIRRTAEEALS